MENFETNIVFESYLYLGGDLMFKKKKAKCSKCLKEIEKGEMIYVKMQYPYYDGMVRISKYFEQEGEIICLKCLKND